MKKATKNALDTFMQCQKSDNGDGGASSVLIRSPLIIDLSKRENMSPS